MSKQKKLLEAIVKGNADQNIRFNNLQKLLQHLGFEERIKGSHHIFRKEGIRELINLQRDGDKAKAYQIRQVRNILIKYTINL